MCEVTVNERTCVVLMTYGSPATLNDVPSYLRNIRSGREPDEALVSEFLRRYRLIGGSPLVHITAEQAERLQLELDGLNDGSSYKVVSGMRFSPPLIADVVKRAAPESGHVVGIIMSPQFSPIIMGGYVSTLREAVASLHRDRLALKIAEDWHLQPYFLEAVAQRVREGLARFPHDIREEVPVLFTAHSMPKRVIEKDPDYIKQLKGTAAAVAELVGLQEGRWAFCYQSAGHTPEEWLKPDFADVMPELRKAGYAYVLIAPVQFLADHLEVLYDIEIGARQQAEGAGMKFARIESLNTSPLLINALTEVVQQTLAQAR
jgi:ferrochelatase